MSLGTSNRDGGKTSESGHLRALSKAFANSNVISGLKISQRAAGANMSVDLAIGDAFLPRSDGTYSHPVFNDAVLNTAITAADVSNPRRDIFVIYVDYAEAPDTGVSNNTNGVVKVMVVAGTPAGSPSDPSDVAIQAAVGSGNPFIKLARIRVGAGVTTIANSVIDDLRVFASPVLGNNAPQGQLINGVITPSVASNNLTVAIKTLAGTDPSPTDPVFVRVGDVVRRIETAISVTKNSGTNWFGSGTAPFATKSVRYTVYIGYNATDGITIGFARISNSRKYSDFHATSTNISYAAISTITNASATDVYENVGCFNAILSASASFNWSLPSPNVIQSFPNRGGGMPRSGTLTPSGTGDLTVSGLPFRPRYIEFVTLYASSNAVASGSNGNCNELGEQYCFWWSAGVTGSDKARNSSTSNCIASGAATGTTNTNLASFVSMNDDGFTVNFSAQTGQTVGYTAYP